MPRRRAEAQLIRRAAFLSALVLLGPASARAQQVGEASARASLEAALRVTSIRDEAALLAGGTGLLDLGLPLRFGGSGWFQIGSSSVPGGGAGSDYEMRTAYGGIAVELDLVRNERGALAWRTVLAVGNAEVSLPIVGTVIGADNFGVVEPEVSGRLRLTSALAAVVAAGYRFTFGVEDLPNVPPADLRGPSLRIGLSFGAS